MNLPGLELLERLAEGDLTTVWKARQISLDRIVLVKVLKPEFAAHPDEVQRFVEDGRAAAALNHPHTIHLYDVGIADGTPYYVMEYVGGPTVEERIRHHGPLPSREALYIAGCTAQALQYAWDRQRVIHRNVKPANIHVEPGGTVKLRYLGLAWRVALAPATGRSVPPPIEGTPWYMAPEQVRGHPLDCRSDMYGLGATLYQMITGRAPFQELHAEAALKAQLEAQIPHPSEVVSAVPAGVAFLITRLLMKRPEDRFRDWTQVLEVIEKIQAGSIVVGRLAPEALSTVAAPGSSPSGLRRRARRHVPRPAEARRAVRKRKSDIPAWVRGVAVVGLLVWTALLGYRLWGVTLPLPRPPLDLPQAAGMRKPPAGPAPVGVPTTTLRRPSGVSGEGAGALSPTEARLLRDTAEEMVRHLLQWNVSAAARVPQKALNSASSEALRRGLEELQALAEGFAQADALVLERVRQHLGQPLEVTWADGRRTRLIVRQVTPRGFTAVPAGDASTSRAETLVLLEEIDPSERAAWIGEPEGPALTAAVCVLYLRAGKLAQAEALASRAGPLAEALRKVVQSRKLQEGFSP